MKAVSMMLKAIYFQESKETAREKAMQIEEKLKEMKLSAAAKKLQEGIEEPLTYMGFPTQHCCSLKVPFIMPGAIALTVNMVYQPLSVNFVVVTLFYQTAKDHVYFYVINLQNLLYVILTSVPSLMLISLSFR